MRLWPLTFSPQSTLPIAPVEILVLLFSFVFPLILWGPCTFGPDICFNDAGWADYRLHFVAISAYLNSSHWIPSYLQAFTWPQYSSLMYADAYPLPSILLWPIYQFIKFPVGIIFPLLSILNSLCTAFLAILFARSYNLQPLRLILLSFFLISSPISWNRLLSGHESLQLHSLVLAPLILLLVSHRKWGTWTLLLVCTSGINPYYLPFSTCCYIISALMPNTLLSLRHKPIWLLSSFLCCLGTLIICGYIPGYSQSMSQIWGANMLSLFNPQSTSSILGSLTVSEPFELEGYSYLGISLSLLFLVALIFPAERLTSQHSTRIFQASLLCTLFLVFSWGLTWNISGQPIISPYLHLGFHKLMVSIYGAFRSAGRFTWPTYYLIIIWSTCAIKTEHLRRLLPFALSLQLLELVIPLSSRINHTLNARYTNGINPSQTWSSRNKKVAALLRETSYYLVLESNEEVHKDDLMPPYTPQYLNPSIKSNWGGANLSRRPTTTLALSQQLLLIPSGKTAVLYLTDRNSSLLPIIAKNFAHTERMGDYLFVKRN